MSIVEYPGWEDELRHRKSGESAGEQICRMVRFLNGASLVHEQDKLCDLFLCNEPASRAKLIAGMKTNCATTMREFLCLAGCDHPLVICEYVVGMAMAWVLQAARELDALEPASAWKLIRPGDGMWYGTPGHNDDHVEWCLETPNQSTGHAVHGGGGRSQNLISVEPASDIRWSRGRPLRGILLADKMCTNPATGDNPY
jgi:hypothetical protein